MGIKSERFLTPDMTSKKMSDMASGWPNPDQSDVMSGIVFLTPCLASKAEELYPRNQLNNLGKTPFKYIQLKVNLL